MHTQRDAAEKQQKQTYFLVAGEIVMELSEDSAPTAVRLNTVVMSKDDRFALEQIAKAQQVLQYQLHKRMDDPTIKIVDVVILGIMNLGQFTAEEFNARRTELNLTETSQVLPN